MQVIAIPCPERGSTELLSRSRCRSELTMTIIMCDAIDHLPGGVAEGLALLLSGLPDLLLGISPGMPLWKHSSRG